MVDIVDKQQLQKLPEASASAMLIYTLAKGMRKGYLPLSYLEQHERAMGDIKTMYKNLEWAVNLHGTVSVSD